jgi:hypothetical protein
MTDFTPEQIDAAIAAEAIDWAIFFKVTDAVSIEGRRQVMRANVAVGFFKPLLPYLLVSQSTGDIDMVALRVLAKKRADREFRGDAPPSWVRSEIENLKTEAYFIRRDWRAARGFPDDTVYVDGFAVVEPR